MDGTIENKIFAPGYGEFLTGVGENLEELAIAVPTDAVPGRLPAELATLSTGASRIFSMAAAGNWNAASSTADKLIAAWDSHQRRDVPRMLDAQMSEALVRLVAAVDARVALDARQAALDVERAGLDLELQYRSPVKVDLALLDVWARQKALDSAAGDRAGVRSDMAILSAIRARVAPFLGGSSPGAAM